MADSMCGPSNGAKNLLAHADRDRSLHQDRLANAAQAGPGNVSIKRSRCLFLLDFFFWVARRVADFRRYQVFRTQAAHANGAEMAFGGFQQAGMPMDASFGPGLDMNAIGPIGHHPAVARPLGAPMAHAGPSAAAARLASPASGGVSHQEWVNQFSSMQLGSGAAGPSNAMPAQAHPMAAPMNPAMNYHHPAPFMPMFGGVPPSMNAMAQQQAQAAKIAQDEAAKLNDEAFDKAFGEYDAINFENELAEWKEKRKLANAEFAVEQDKWMAEHGPRADSKLAPSADEMAVIDATMEKIADEQDKIAEEKAKEKKRDDEELARAASDIVNAVAENKSQKFANSRFFALMRQISAHQVVIDGQNFINVNTGEKVDTAPVVDDDDDKPASGNSNSGAGSSKAAGAGAVSA